MANANSLRKLSLHYLRFIRNRPILRLSRPHLVACAVRYFCVALLLLRLSSLDKVPETGAPTPFMTTPWPPFAIETALSSLMKSQLKLFMCSATQGCCFFKEIRFAAPRKIFSLLSRPRIQLAGRSYSKRNLAFHLTRG